MKVWTYLKFLILDLRKGFANAITLYLQMLTIQISIQTDNHTYRKVLQLWRFETLIFNILCKKMPFWNK